MYLPYLHIVASAGLGQMVMFYGSQAHVLPTDPIYPIMARQKCIYGQIWVPFPYPQTTEPSGRMGIT